MIGLSGETISFSEDDFVYIDGNKLAEPYLPESVIAAYEVKTYKIGSNEFFVMGDNRNNSADSRVFGPISIDKVFGKVIFIYGPISRAGKPT